MNCIDCDHPVEIHTRYGCMHETKTDDGHVLCECFKGKQEVELEAARARIAELEAALENIAEGYIHETASGWNVPSAQVEKAPLVIAARKALENKP